MKKQQKGMDILIIGFALFAMFFGAGNLIFPPLLGLQAGDSAFIATVGFLLTGVGVPLLGVIATAKAGGRVEHLADPISKWFSRVLSIIIILCIGPLFAIPRTAATSYEIGILPLFPNIAPWVFSLVYFAITLFFVINPSEVVDRVGKYLTPGILIVLVILVIKGFIDPIGTPVHTADAGHFGTGFREGYQTMDALASVIFTSIVIGGIIKRGYTDSKDQIQMTAKAGILAAVLLFFVYGGLAYLGSSAGSVFPQDTERTVLILGIVESLLGQAGFIVLSLAIGLACLSTAIGLVSSCGEFFSHLSGGKISYQMVCIITIVVSFFLSILGVTAIIEFAVPVLTIVYPPVITLILLNLIGGRATDPSVMRGGVFGALIISLIEVFSSIFGLNNFAAGLPFASQGFGWITGAIIGIIIGLILDMIRDRN